MRGRTRKPPKALHSDIIREIVDVVTKKLNGREPNQPIWIHVSNFQEFARNPDVKDQQVIKERLWKVGIICDSFVGDQYIFHNRAK